MDAGIGLAFTKSTDFGIIPNFNYNNFSNTNHSYSSSHSHPNNLSILTNSVAAPAAAT
jgi:hypothetical protein